MGEFCNMISGWLAALISVITPEDGAIVGLISQYDYTPTKPVGLVFNNKFNIMKKQTLVINCQ